MREHHRHPKHHTYDDAGQAMGHEFLSGEHIPGMVREHEEMRRKEHYMSEFHANHEGLHENHGHDRNRMGEGNEERRMSMKYAR